MSRRFNQFKVEKLGRLLLYILGHRPDEFGLVPDRNGFVRFKELLQAIHEEEDWHFVRQSHINEVLLGKDRRLFEYNDKGISVLERRWQMITEPVGQNLPRVLFTAIRRKAHPVVMEKGLKSNEDRYLILSADKEMALRIGRRRDQKPVLLKILASAADKDGVLFYSFLNLFLSPQITAEFIDGPPVSAKILASLKDRETKKEEPAHQKINFKPGSFPLDLSRDTDPYRKAKRKKRKGWKEEARKIRRKK